MCQRICKIADIIIRECRLTYNILNNKKGTTESINEQLTNLALYIAKQVKFEQHVLVSKNSMHI